MPRQDGFNFNELALGVWQSRTIARSVRYDIVTRGDPRFDWGDTDNMAKAMRL